MIDRNPVKGRSGIRLRTRGKPPREHLEADETLSLIYAADLLDQGTSPIALQRAAQIKARRAAGFRWDDIAAEFEIPQATAIYQSRSCANPVASRRRRALIVVLAFTGVRASELVDLTWGRLDHTHGRIVLNDAKAAAGVREIYLSPFVRKELELYRHSIPEPQPAEPVFAPRTGGTMRRQNVNHRLNTIVAAGASLRSIEQHAPLPSRITPHTFRRTFITLSFQAGKDLVFVQSQAGHAPSLSTSGETLTIKELLTFDGENGARWTCRSRTPTEASLRMRLPPAAKTSAA